MIEDLSKLITPCLLFLYSFSIQAQHFEDKSSDTAFDVYGQNSGVAIGDANSDGWEDIYVSRKNEPNLLYINKGNFQFEEQAQEYGLAHAGNTRLSLWFDYNNDGKQDLLIGNTFEACRLYQNDGESFSDVTFSANLNYTSNLQSAAAVDYDNDGDLDLYLARTLQDNLLLRNEGSYFIDVTSQSGIADDLHSMGAVFFDYDMDGDQDLYQTRDFQDGNLFFENQDGVFVEISASNFTNYAGDGMGVDVADFDGDGKMDIYFSNLYDNVLLKQNEDKTFTAISENELQDPGMGWGVFFFDAENNTTKDLYLANDSHFAVNGENHSNRLFLNLDGSSFAAPPMSEDVNNMHASYGAAYADFDKDGKLDFVVINRGDAPNQIFRNQSNAGNFINLDFIGSNSNTQGVGVRAELEVSGVTYVDQTTCGSGYASQSTGSLHFGLNDAEHVDKLSLFWPSGKVQVFENVESNRFLRIHEEGGILGNGPVVWTDPAFPTQQDDVLVYFDATQGNGALAGFTGDVYAHTGLITTNSNSPTDWQHVQGTWGTEDPNVLMTRVDTDLYTLEYNIADYYGINAGEVVEQLAFVFRNGNGSIVGRSEDGSDIYADVYPPDQGLLVSLVSPDPEGEIIFSGDSVFIQLELNQKAWLEITDNETNIFQDSIVQTGFWHTINSIGDHELEFKVSLDEDEEILYRKVLVLEADELLENPPTGSRPGINYLASSYVFVLTAPMKEHVFFLCPANDFQIDLSFRMKKTEDQDQFWIELPKSLFGTDQHMYQYLVDGSIKIADPFAEVVLDPWNDGGVPLDVMEELPAYPENQTTGIVTAFDPSGEEYNWQANDYELPQKADLIIYEILMRDFLSDKNYKSLLDTLDYLEHLGINAIELMPIQEFEGNQSWGYNPSFHMALDKYYGSRDQLKAVIDECHKRGIAVILDVVFNHAFSQSPLCQLYWNAADFRPSPDSPYLNETARHPFNVGYDFNHESAYTKEWVKRVLSHWIEEYRFDGFRFDLSKGLTQTFSGNNSNLMSQYDQSRIDILTDYANHIWSLDEDSYVILEHFAANGEELALSDLGMMLWGNMTHDFQEAAMGYSSNLGWADYTERNWNEPNLIAYMESHDEERMGYKLKSFGNSSGDYDTKELATGAERVVAASVIYMTIPGPKMLWQFGELAYDFSINRCTNGTISNDCRLDPKPIRWDYFEDASRNELYEKISALNFLKATNESFKTTDFELFDGNSRIKAVRLNHPEMDVVSLANFNVNVAEVNSRIPYSGIWYEYFTGVEKEFTEANQVLDFLPGEYRIYTSKKVDTPFEIFTSTEEELEAVNMSLFPNPVLAGESVMLDIDVDDSRLKLLNSNGVQVDAQMSRVEEGVWISTKELSAGIYFLKVEANKKQYFRKLVIFE